MLKVELIGNLGADAEVKESNGVKFVTMRVADTRKVKQDSGVDKSVTTWVDVTLSNVDSPVLPYLRQGVKVFVRGNAALRVYSSPKLRMMVAGLTIHATEIELCGGSSDDVPRQLIVPDTSQLIDVTKHYWVNIDTKGMKKDDLRPLIDAKGNQYVMDAGGFVHVVEEQPADNDSQNNG